MEQKNFILAVVLSVGFILFWTTIVMPHFTPPPVPVAASSVDSSMTGAAAVAPGAEFSRSGEKSQTLAFGAGEDQLVLDARGGGVESWKQSSKIQTFDFVLMPDVQPLPLASFSDTLFKIARTTNGAVMTATLPSGIRVVKTLSLSSVGHLHTMTYEFANPTGKDVQLPAWDWGWGPGLGTVATEAKENAGLTRGLSMGPLKAHVIKDGMTANFGRWVGLDNRYFLVAFIPTSAHTTQFFVTGKKESTRIHLQEQTLVPAHGKTLLSYELYVGPKGYTQLKKYNRDLEASVDFGFFSPVGKIILSALYRIKAMTGNYGVSIILLTLILQIMLSPLTLKSFKAAQSMKKLQPKIARLQEAYKGDPKRLNVEMMNLYKTSGTNPFGGCLPMVLQLPIFWALFTTLRNAYELRGSPFVGWIHDLSVHDPLYILPVIMGGGMFFQQRMTGASSDPTQRQMMYIMPVMFTAMFMNFPAGLVLYWMTNSFATILFQWTYLRLTTGTPNRPEIIKP